ncbi:Hypothetical_protein [Hexamita inflata]|uniref:Hypothetical_protein n=1 Tax=Hexamita inflata TaxID=28002 RepID=A0AA86QGW2_9EUKA|nr:Hypothetical protein HINF_LOCUS46175 [Hexamita inflata]
MQVAQYLNSTHFYTESRAIAQSLHQPIDTLKIEQAQQQSENSVYGHTLQYMQPHMCNLFEASQTTPWIQFPQSTMFCCYMQNSVISVSSCGVNLLAHKFDLLSGESTVYHVSNSALQFYDLIDDALILFDQSGLFSYISQSYISQVRFEPYLFEKIQVKQKSLLDQPTLDLFLDLKLTVLGISQNQLFSFNFKQKQFALIQHEIVDVQFLSAALILLVQKTQLTVMDQSLDGWRYKTSFGQTEEEIKAVAVGQGGYEYFVLMERKIGWFNLKQKAYVGYQELVRAWSGEMIKSDQSGTCTVGEDVYVFAPQ